MPVNVKKITHERLGRWEKRLVGSNATPVLLLGVGHDQVSGQIAICVTEDCTDQQIIDYLRIALLEMERSKG